MPRASKYKKRADGFYQSSLVVGRKPDGRPIRKTFYAKTIKELDQKRFAYEQRHQHGTLSSDEKMRFGDLARLWLERYKPGIAPGTRRNYQTILDKHLLPELDAYRLIELKPHHLQSLINERAEDGYAQKTMRDIRMVAVQILGVAVDNDILFRNAFARVTVPSVEPTERRPLTPDEIALVERCWKGHRMGVPVLIMLHCGLRRGELLALTWADVDFEHKRISVSKSVYFDKNQPVLKTPKSKAGTRSVPIPDAMIPVLACAFETAKSKASLVVCPSAKGNTMSEAAFRSAWNSYLHYLNLQVGGRDASRARPAVQILDHITPHMLRHSYATMLYDAGVDVKNAQEMLGHADLKVTLGIYTHLSQDKRTQAYAAINAHLAVRDALRP